MQQAWKTYSHDYLNQLNLRHNLVFLKDNLKPNDLTLIKDMNMSLYKWELGCIDKIIMDLDTNLRVVLIKTANRMIRRGISQISKCCLRIAKTKT